MSGFLYLVLNNKFEASITSLGGSYNFNYGAAIHPATDPMNSVAVSLPKLVMNNKRLLINSLLSKIADLYSSAMSEKTVSITLKMVDVEHAYNQSKSGSGFLVPIVIQDCSVVVKYQPSYTLVDSNPVKVSITQHPLVFSDFDSQHTDPSNERKVHQARALALIGATEKLMKDSKCLTTALQELCLSLYTTFQEIERFRTTEFDVFPE